MRSPLDLHPYQAKAVEFQTSRPHSALWLDVGLGKTAITLTSIAHLINTGQVPGVIVVAPIRVCRLVWRQEALKWSHTRHLKFSMLTGTKDQRTRALMTQADVYLLNYENLGWLAETIHKYFVTKGRPLPFGGIVYDEIDKCSNSTTQRVKALMKILDQLVWRTGLTGTPASNGFRDLHGQYLVLDGGQRLGESKTKFLTQWYKKGDGYKQDIPYRDTLDGIKGLIADMTLEMSEKDYNPLPDLITNDIEVDLPDNVRALYEQLEKEFFIQMDSGAEVEVFNQASLTNKLLQFSNGAVYPLPGMPMWEPVHDLKLDALDDLIQESNGQPILCAYSYRSDAERIMDRFHDLKPINLTECKSETSLMHAMSRWQAGDCQLMVGHPASMGHGTDGLQTRGHILAWFGLNWSPRLYKQMNGRLRRQGQGVPVICNRILCSGTFDQAQATRLADKDEGEAAIRAAIKEYRATKERVYA